MTAKGQEPCSGSACEDTELRTKNTFLEVVPRTPTKPCIKDDIKVCYGMAAEPDDAASCGSGRKHARCGSGCSSSTTGSDTGEAGVTQSSEGSTTGSDIGEAVSSGDTLGDDEEFTSTNDELEAISTEDEFEAPSVLPGCPPTGWNGAQPCGPLPGVLPNGCVVVACVPCAGPVVGFWHQPSPAVAVAAAAPAPAVVAAPAAPAAAAAAGEEDYVTDDEAEAKQFTSVTLRHLLSILTRAELLALLDKCGLRGALRFLYLPMDFAKKTNLTYAHVVFDTYEAAVLCQQKLPQVMHTEVVWASRKFQGTAFEATDENVERYRNSPVMHETVDDCFRPMIFGEGGERLPFPPPTKKIRKPRNF